MRPDWFVIGVQKSATTWLYQCLREHPDLFLPPHKREFEYLAAPRYGPTEHGIEAFWKLFEGAKAGQQVVHVSVEYAFDPRAAEAVRRELPESRFLLVLRNPIERAVSAHAWINRKGMVPAIGADDALIDALTNGEASPFAELLTRGHYDVQLARYLEHFDGQQMTLVFYDHIETQPAATLRAIYDVVGVRPDITPPSLGRRPKVTVGNRAILAFERLFRKDPARQAGLLARAGSWAGQRATEWLYLRRGRVARPTLRPDVREQLRRYFEPHLTGLEALMPRVQTLAGLPPVQPLRDWS